MIEQVFRYTVTQEKTIERIVADEPCISTTWCCPKARVFPNTSQTPPYT